MWLDVQLLTLNHAGTNGSHFYKYRCMTRGKKNPHCNAKHMTHCCTTGGVLCYLSQTPRTCKSIDLPWCHSSLQRLCRSIMCNVDEEAVEIRGFIWLWLWFSCCVVPAPHRRTAGPAKWFVDGGGKYPSRISRLLRWLFCATVSYTPPHSWKYCMYVFILCRFLCKSV